MMLSLKKLLIPGALAASLLLAACGSSSSGSGSPAAGSSMPANQPAAASSGGAVTIGTAGGSGGTYLTGASGRALYIWVADSKDKSVCSGACAQAWPPLTAATTPKVSGGVNASQISLISRSDGAKQVAYKGQPLYYYVGDTRAGTTTGNGSNQFGAKWWLLSPAGTYVGASSTAGASSGAKAGW
jgi:predicted lipoprotein with Yx(FWY)xxD motif